MVIIVLWRKTEDFIKYNLLNFIKSLTPLKFMATKITDFTINLKIQGQELPMETELRMNIVAQIFLQLNLMNPDIKAWSIHAIDKSPAYE